MKFNRIAVLFWYILSRLTSLQKVHSMLNATRMTSILKEVLLGYDRMVAPVENELPVNVTIQFLFNDMFPYEATHMHYSADFYIKMVWYDYRLVHNKTDNKSYIPLGGRSRKIWLPDIYFPNARKGLLHNVPEVNEGSHVYLNGTVLHVQRINLVSFCPMELNYYPFDIQSCTFGVSTFINSREFIRLKWNKQPMVKLVGKLQMKDFNIVKYKFAEVIKTSERDGEYDTLEIRFQFFRYLAFYFLRDFFPCILIVLLSWITFWIDYSSTPARVAMGITTVLTIVTMTNSIRNNAPPAGLFRSLDYYLLMCNLFVFAALAEYAVVGYTSRKGIVIKEKKKQKADNSPLKKNLNNAFLEMTDLHLRFSPEKQKSEGKKKEPNPTKKKKEHYIDKLSRFLFPCMFCVLNIIYFVYHRLNKNTVD